MLAAIVASPTLGALVSHRSPFVGREAERALLLELLDDGGPLIAFVHGIAGVGKSSLLAAFAAEAAAAGAAVVAVDGEAIEPTEAGFRRALGELPRGPRVVIAIDGYERLRLLDDWLRRVFVPGLPAHARVVVAGRDAPIAAWSATYGPLLRVLALDTLASPDAVEMLLRLGVPPNRAVPINRILRGHPLSLQLAASIPAGAVRPAIDELARVYFAGLDPATRAALDAASVVRRVTLPLLEAMVPDARAAFDRLRALPFVALGDEGLHVHHVVREAVAAELRAVDPSRHRRLRTAAWRQLRDELDRARPDELWRYTADMLYLLENPAVRDAFFPTSAPEYSIEPAAPQDGVAIMAIASRHEPPAGAALVRDWWEAAPEAFTVARDAAGRVAGFRIACEPVAAGTRLLERDPVAARWRAHLRANPLPHGQTALFIRAMCGAETGERPAAVQAALYLDVKRIYLTLRPALRRIYTCAYEIGSMAPILEPLGFARLDGPLPQLDGVPYQCYCNDLGPASIDGWLAGLAARDVLGGGAPLLDPERRRLVLGDDTEGVDLSPLEFGVLRCLHERGGAVVRREVLLREVWGHEWTGDGNALEAVVSGLRRKLGDRAGALETVRGVGYRLRPLL